MITSWTSYHHRQMMEDRMRNKIVERRRELGMTQDDLAAAAGIGRSTISEIEAGKHEPSLSVARKIAEELNITIDELFPLD